MEWIQMGMGQWIQMTKILHWCTKNHWVKDDQRDSNVKYNQVYLEF